MRKYKEYFYTIKKDMDKLYVWYIRSAKDKNGNREILQISDQSFCTKLDAQINCEESIDEYYY